jgi:crotonobetainyl-CoA:carnitine CoA-transferase CaiB-like acyl-CoA transferase
MTAQAPFLKPLVGTRILELGQGVAVRVAGRLLHDLGAEVTRVELSSRRPR